MMCDHPNASWDWGDMRGSKNRVIVPGYCPDCEASLDRKYGFEGVHQL